MIRIASTISDRAAAAHARARLTAHGRAVAPADALEQPGVQGEPLILVWSAAAAADPAVETAILHAHDAGQPMVVVAADDAPLSRWIDHLQPIALSSDPDLAAVRAAIDAAEAGHFQMRVRTPAAQRANRVTGAVVAVIALVIFGFGLYGVGVLGIQRPSAEFDAVETEIILTRDVLARPELDRYARFLPANPADPAVDFAPTLRLVPTAYRPLLSMTATAYAQGTPLPPTLTPVPGE